MRNVQAAFIRLTAAIALGVAITAMPAALSAADPVREACTHDAFRLCSSAIPDVEKTKACLAQKRASLSPLCKSAFGSAAPLRHHRRRHR